jgi:hypothetical protein
MMRARGVTGTVLIEAGATNALRVNSRSATAAR